MFAVHVIIDSTNWNTCPQTFFTWAVGPNVFTSFLWLILQRGLSKGSMTWCAFFRLTNQYWRFFCTEGKQLLIGKFSCFRQNFIKNHWLTSRHKNWETPTHCSLKNKLHCIVQNTDSKQRRIHAFFMLFRCLSTTMLLWHDFWAQLLNSLLSWLQRISNNEWDQWPLARDEFKEHFCRQQVIYELSRSAAPFFPKISRRFCQYVINFIRSILFIFLLFFIYLFFSLSLSFFFLFVWIRRWDHNPYPICCWCCLMLWTLLGPLYLRISEKEEKQVWRTISQSLDLHMNKRGAFWGWGENSHLGLEEQTSGNLHSQKFFFFFFQIRLLTDTLPDKQLHKEMDIGRKLTGQHVHSPTRCGNRTMKIWTKNRP